MAAVLLTHCSEKMLPNSKCYLYKLKLVLLIAQVL